MILSEEIDCRNRQVFTYIRANTGQTNAQIAREFGFPEGTTKAIINKISKDYPIFEEDGAFYVLEKSYLTNY